MCEMYVAVRREMLGAREIGWSLWTGKEVLETTATGIKEMIKEGKHVAGLKVGEDGSLELDKEGFYTVNMIEHRAAGNYKAMVDRDHLLNVMYTVIGKSEENGNIEYECISNKWEKLRISEADIRAYIKLGMICSGAKLDGNDILVADVRGKKLDEKEQFPEMKCQIHEEKCTEVKEEHEDVFLRDNLKEENIMETEVEPDLSITEKVETKEAKKKPVRKKPMLKKSGKK